MEVDHSHAEPVNCPYRSAKDIFGAPNPPFETARSANKSPTRINKLYPQTILVKISEGKGPPEELFPFHFIQLGDDVVDRVLNARDNH